MRGLFKISPGELSARRDLRGKTGLYKAGFIDGIASVYADRDWVTPLRISPQTSTLFHPWWTDELEDIPVYGRWTSVRWQNVHAYLLVTFDYCFFSSDLISNRVCFCRYGLCVIYPGTLTSVLVYYLVVARFLLAMEQAGPSSASSAPLDGTFLRLSLDLASDQLYDLAPEIPDVMELRGLWASVAIVNVCSEQAVYSSSGSG